MRLTPKFFKMTATALFLGRLPFAQASNVQHNCVKKLLRDRLENDGEASNRNFLLILEHNPVYTVGIRQADYSEEEERRLRCLGADFFRTDRGGLITFHGPGQLVAYPILDLHAYSRSGPIGFSGNFFGVRRYIHLIEQVIIETVRHGFGLLEADRTINTGVWLGNGQRKIAAIGVNVKDGITTHGLAINCNNDLDWFKQIVPCGLVGKEVTSLSVELNKIVEVNQVVPALLDKFEEAFKCQIVESDEETHQNLCSD